MLWWLPIAFAGVAFLYSLAGFGGGSTYIALLAISGLPLATVPVIALTCNLLVTVQGSVMLIRKGYAHWRLIVPLLAGSIPAAYAGGAWRMSSGTFLVILATALTVAGVAMIWTGKPPADGQASPRRAPGKPTLFTTGLLLGLVAGITGIGGGIYLAPVMHLLRWSNSRAIAACTSLFIALNSAAGLAGQLSKGIDFVDALPVLLLIGCPLAVIIGGQLGSRSMLKKLPQERIRQITAIVILLVAFRLWLMVLVP